MFVRFGLILLIFVLSNDAQPVVHFQWNFINYTWPSPEVYNRAIEDGSYIKEHNVISGVKVWKDRLYLAVPRLKNGTPVTLTSTLINGNGLSPLLEPFPNWEMQRISDCSALQFVQSMEIDPKGRMWVINNGRIDVRMNNSRDLCPTRLMIFDLENQGEILLDYTFPEGVIHSKSVYLNDLVLDHEDGGFAYITDNDKKYPGIVVFSLKKQSSWKVSHESMLANEKAFDFIVNGTKLTAESNIDGIALSPASSETSGRILYYAPLSSYETFAVPTFILKLGKPGIINDRFVKKLGSKPSQSDGMMMSSSGILYFGYLVKHTIVYWDSKNPSFTDSQEVLAEDPEILEWPDSFCIDENGYLWNTAKKQSSIRTNRMDAETANFKVIRHKVDSKNYQYYQNGKAPNLSSKEESPLSIKLVRNFIHALNRLGQRISTLS